MAWTGRLAARRNARLLPTGRVARGVAQRSRAVHPLPPPRLETEQRSSPPPLPPPCAVRLTRRHSAPRHCSTWGPTAASAAAAAAGPTAAAPSQIRLGGDPRRRIAGLEPPITIPGDRDPRLRHLLAGTHTYGAGTHSCHSTAGPFTPGLSLTLFTPPFCTRRVHLQLTEIHYHDRRPAFGLSCQTLHVA